MPPKQHFSRRGIFKWTAKAVVAGALAPYQQFAAGQSPAAQGVVIGEPAAEKAGTEILARGGNVVDAIVCAALTAAVAAFREAVAPAVKLARGGFKLSEGLALNMRGCGAQFQTDDGSRKLYLKDGEPLGAGETFRNPDLAALLSTLAERNSVDSFYRGDIAQQIAHAFKTNGGLLTVDDLAAYRAREVEPLALSWRGFDIRTAPPTAGGLTVLQALRILQAMDWAQQPAGFARTHARIEALRFAWHDRLRWLGDPDKSEVPVAKLLSREYADEAAGQIRRVVKAGKILPLRSESRRLTGTINLSAVDRRGNLAVCTTK